MSNVETMSLEELAEAAIRRAIQELPPPHDTKELRIITMGVPEDPCMEEVHFVGLIGPKADTREKSHAFEGLVDIGFTGARKGAVVSMRSPGLEQDFVFWVEFGTDASTMSAFRLEDATYGGEECWSMVSDLCVLEPLSAG